MLVSQGVIQNFKAYDTVKVVEPQQVQKVGQDGKPVIDKDGKPVMDTVTDQTIAQGPFASQESIKELGTNGGGPLNANSAHPFENPTPFSNFYRDGADLLHTVGFDLYAGANDRLAEAWLGCFCGHGGAFLCRSYHSVLG